METTTDAINLVMEFVDYDITNSVKDLLEGRFKPHSLPILVRVVVFFEMIHAMLHVRVAQENIAITYDI